ncbi:transcriptional regulator PpsR [Sandarakinorhabdus sp. DWP1-3-1]|uniref:transcriptional regulator PpsR n=1 Tax=Sandarakinorhabdus sp. DWP1-3-1 TaxID=2804627 RepID=UPI003CF33045
MDARTATHRHRTTETLSGGLAALPADVATQALAAACDITLVIDGKGIIRDVSIGGDELSGHGFDEWVDRPWADTVAPENRGKIDEMLAGGGVPGRWRQVNHETPSGDLPVRYLAMPSGRDGGFVAIGRDVRATAAMQQRLLRAQQAMERDSLRLRQLEARYRLLFDSAPEAIIVIDATSRRLLEANPAARRIAGLGAGPLDSSPFTAIIHPDDRDAAIALVGAAAAAEQRHPGRLRLADGQPARVSATLYRQDRGNALLVRMVPLSTPGISVSDRPLDEVLERMPDAFVLTDGTLNILAANGAFLDLVQQPRRDDVRGRALTTFLGRPGIDVALLESQLREHGSVRGFATVVHGSGGSEAEVEVSAVTTEDAGAVRHGLSLRVVGRPPVVVADDRQVPRSVEQLTELVGRVSLKEIVRESTDLIERLCIEAALTYTSDNRASAAEILGLSRQSLYSKLHRHGLGNLSDND